MLFFSKDIDRKDLIAVFIAAIGAIMRFYNYDGWSLSNDELSAMARLQFSSFAEMIENGVKLNDMHPAGVQTFLWFWTHTFGISEAMFRLPFVILGIGSIWILYLISGRWFNKSTALFTIGLFAVLEFPVLYSQLARPYSPGLFFVLLFAYAFSKIVFPLKDENENKLKYFALFIVAGAASMYTHYFAFMLAGIIGITGFFFIEKKERIKYILSGLIMLLLYVPNLKIFIYQFSIGGLGGDGGWLGPPKPDAIFSYIAYSLNNSFSIIFLCFAFFVISIFIYRGIIKWSKFHSMALLFFLLPALIAYFYSIFKNPVFQYSILLFSFPFLLMLIFSFVPLLEWSWRQTAAIAVLVLLVGFNTVVSKNFYNTQHFAVFKDVAEKTAFYNDKYGSANVTSTVNVINPFYINYYLDKQKNKFNYEMYKCTSAEQFLELSELVKKSDTKYFLHGWSNTYNAVETEQIIMQFYPYIAGKDSFFNSGIKVYSKNEKENYFPRRISFTKTNDCEKADWENDTLFIDKSLSYKGESSYHIKPENEYSPGFKIQAKDISLRKNSTIEISLWSKSITDLADVSIVFSVNDGDRSVLWRGSRFSDYKINETDWRQVLLGYYITEEINPEDKVSIYIYNPAHKEFYADDFRINVLN